VKDVKSEEEEDPEAEEEDVEEITLRKRKKKDNMRFIIQMFGKNEQGKTCSIIVKDYAPFFYVKIPENWGMANKLDFVNHLKEEVLGNYFKDGLIECKLVKRKKLYGFDGGKLHKFLVLKFVNMRVYYKVRGLFYNKQKKLQLYRGFQRQPLELYEANIPPLLRFFHIKEISPSGWISLSDQYKTFLNRTTCDYEYEVNYKKIVSLPNKETLVPYKICSFDIEASSSHGDFPLPKKSYKKPANQIIDKLQKFDGTDEEVTELFKTMVRNGFGYGDEDLIDIVYTKKKISEQTIDKKIETMLGLQVEDIEHGTDDDTLEKWFKSVSIDGEGDGDGDGNGTWCGMAGGASGGGSGGRRNMNQLHRGSLLHFLRSGAVKDDKVAKLSDAMNNLYIYRFHIHALW
jgi:hypothetical protein